MRPADSCGELLQEARKRSPEDLSPGLGDTARRRRKTGPNRVDLDPKGGLECAGRVPETIRGRAGGLGSVVRPPRTLSYLLDFGQGVGRAGGRRTPCLVPSRRHPIARG
jgi:hypothetical protein